MNDIRKVFENARRVDVYLAWQTISDGRKQIRRYSPHAFNSELRLFEPANKQAIQWLEQNGNPDFNTVNKIEPGYAPFRVFYIGKDSCEKI
jgi:hypothetical protein